MDGKRPADALNDDALDRELERALRVEPSPEFLARVRTRAAAEPAPAMWGGRWLLPAASATVAAVALAVAVSLPRPAEISPPNPEATDANAAAPLPAPASVEDAGARGSSAHVRSGRAGPASEPRLADGRTGRRRVTPRPTEAAAARPFPEVVVSAEERQAFALLLTSIGERRLPPLPEGVIAEGRALEAMPLDIIPLVIEPLAPAQRVE